MDEVKQMGSETMSEIIMDKAAIKEIIPHREPFLLVDAITEFEPGKKVKGLWRLTGEEYFFKGHFPEKPVLPGVLMIESIAQVGAVAVLSVPEFAGKIAFMAGIDNVRFKKQVVPGDELRLEVELVKVRGSIGKGQGAAYVNGELAVKVDLTFAIQ